MTAPIKTTIYCNPWQYPLLLDTFIAQAEQRMIDAGATNITDMRYRVVGATGAMDAPPQLGIEFTARADKPEGNR